MLDFDLMVPHHLQECIEILAEHPGARLVAGATDFIPLVSAGKWKVDLAIDISHLEELRAFRVERDALYLGSLTTHAEAASSAVIRQRATALAEACASVADPMIRGRATLGGNLCTASPAADSVPALLALGAELCLLSVKGERRLSLDDFLLGPGRTALQPGEVLVEIKLPLLNKVHTASAFIKLGRRMAMAISVANAAAWMHLQENKVESVRVSLGSVAPTVVRSRLLEEALLKCPSLELAQKMESIELGAEVWAREVRQDISPIDDVRASGAYRRQVAGTLAQRAVRKAWERAIEIDE